MRVSSAVQWWDQSQLQVLVLASLAIQSFLTVFGPQRNRHLPPWLRFFIWLSFLGGDAVAIYALATLFNRQTKVQQISSAAHESHDLEVLWTPILLVHLRGKVTISAYNLEDNKLWTRHIITSLSQITVAVYVFWKSWSSSADKRLLAAAILIFIPGILICMDKPFCLRSSSFSTKTDLGNNLWMVDEFQKEEELEEYINKARAFIASPNLSPSPESTDMTIHYELYADIARDYVARLENLKSFWVLKHQETYNAPKVELYNIFARYYTKSSGSGVHEYMGIGAYIFIFLISPWLFLPVATVLFHTSNKQAYRSSDIIVTLMLLYGTMLLDVISGVMLSVLAASFAKWHDMVAQHSLTEFADYSIRQTKVMTHSFKYRKLLIGYWCMEPCNSSESITSIVRGYVKLWWGEFITDAEHYREVSGFRGQWTLASNGLVPQLGWSLEKPFDESVLLWHIATDLCFHSKPPRQSRCKEISNYMAHLLFRKPDMLMAGSRNRMFMVAIKELTDLDAETSWQDGQGISLKVIEKMKIEESPNGRFVHDAKLLAQVLMDIGQDKMWQVIEGVWVEMLCFSAGRCPAYLQIKSLGSGGEYLSIIWLMLEHAGMESLPERLQKRSLFGHNIMQQNHQNRGSDATAPSVSQDETTISIPAEP